MKNVILALALGLPAAGVLCATTPGEMKDVTLRLSATGTVTALDPHARVGVKPGDSVVAVVHEAVAVGVEPLPK